MADATRTCAAGECDRPIHGRGWCSKHYTRWRTTGSIELATFAERFWSKVDVRSEDACWSWLAGRSDGYGRVSVHGHLPGGPEVWDAHRVSFVLSGGIISAGMELDHVCHTLDSTCPAGAACTHRACVNPAHLELVTHHENALRRERRKATCRRGHPWADSRGRNGDSTRCRECHRIKMQNWRDTGTYAWPGEVA